MDRDWQAAAGQLRAAVVAVAVVGLASGGHLVAGGGAPSLRALLLALLLVGVLSTAVASRRVSALRLSAVIGAGQVVLHHAFAWVPGSHDGAALDPSAVGGHQSLWSDPTMLTAHAVATAVTVALLRRGEAALVAMCSWVDPLVLLLVPGPVPVGPVRSLFHDVEAMPLGATVAAADPVRGPPHLLTLAA